MLVYLNDMVFRVVKGDLRHYTYVLFNSVLEQ